MAQHAHPPVQGVLPLGPRPRALLAVLREANEAWRSFTNKEGAPWGAP